MSSSSRWALAARTAARASRSRAAVEASRKARSVGVRGRLAS
ncbi:hypothetical protein [Streptomyces sp. SID5473]|nr:hypothetical protein [Streptomyces sp. SID5473]